MSLDFNYETLICKKCGNRECIRGMGREKAESPASIIMYDSDHVHIYRILGRSPTLEKWLKHRTGQFVGNYDRNR